MDSTLNVRMNAPLKERGDKVLRDHGISASAAVRALWQEMAASRTIPPFLEEAKQETMQCKKKAAALEALASVGAGSLSALSDQELKAVGMARYE